MEKRTSSIPYHAAQIIQVNFFKNKRSICDIHKDLKNASIPESWLLLRAAQGTKRKLIRQHKD